LRCQHPLGLHLGGHHGIRSYKDLEVWQEGIELAIEVYEYTDRFPSYERFGIISQMCRAAVSIPSNIAEGQCKSRKEFLHHISHSRGSYQELETLLVISERRQYGSPNLLAGVQRRLKVEGRLVSGLRRSLLPG
jgi:four helix bundle protein